MQKRLTVFIGRFSPFHLGHEEVLKRALLSSEVVLLLIGSADSSRTIKNPFTYQERQQMVSNWYDRQLRVSTKVLGRLLIQPLNDHPYNDQDWIAEVQSIVTAVRNAYPQIPQNQIYLTGAKRDASTWYLGAFGSFFKEDFVSESKIGFDFSATQLRDDFFTGGHAWEYKCPQETISFLANWLHTKEYANLLGDYLYIKGYKDSWKVAPYPPTFLTVDACVVQSGHVLVITRGEEYGHGLLALPGGFLEQGERLIDGCVRELQEETSIEMSPAQLYGSIRTKEVFDHPERSLRGRVVTTAFLFKLRDTFSLPKVKPQRREVLKLEWMPIATAFSDMTKWFEDHGHIAKTMIARI